VVSPLPHQKSLSLPNEQDKPQPKYTSDTDGEGREERRWAVSALLEERFLLSDVAGGAEASTDESATFGQKNSPIGKKVEG
jgi:hypothetical protein